MLRPGSLVALHRSKHNRMNAKGQVALHNTYHNRFMRMNAGRKIMDISPRTAANALPADWKWERFTIVDLGKGQVALHNTYHNRFMRMNAGRKIMDLSPRTA